MYNRISIIGGPGSGKTTLSNILSAKYNIPATHIDGIHHLENWQVRNKDERDKIILDIVKKEKWIIDGTYRHTLKQRLDASDLIVWLDYSSFALVKGVVKRFLKNPGKEKQEIPGCKERLSLTFVKYVMKYNKDKRHFITDALQDINEDRVIIFKKQKDLNKWLKEQNIDVKKKA